MLMPLYFFNSRSPKAYHPDLGGVELEDIVAVRFLALKTIRELASDPFKPVDYVYWTLEVADESGQTVLTVPFWAAMQL